MSIVLLDKNPKTCAALQSLISSFGYEVFGLHNADELDAQIALNFPKIILISSFSDFDAMVRLVNHVRYKINFQGPVVIISETLSVLDEAALYEAGISDIIPKPIHEGIIQNKISLHLNIGQQAVSFSDMLENVLGAVVVVNEIGAINHVNLEAERIFGFQPMTMDKGFVLSDLLSEQAQFGVILSAIDNDAITGTLIELKCCRQDGTVFHAECRISRLELQSGNYITLVLRDITDRIELDKKFRHLAQHDQLTGLLNRNSFNEHIRHALTVAERTGGLIAVLYIDLDNFKDVNDEYGHTKGDTVLVTSTAQLQSCLRASDALFRVGGDEFIAVLHNISSAVEAHAVAARMNACVSGTENLNDKCRISTSIGIAMYPVDATTAEELVNKADEAMYRVKGTGKKGVTLYSLKDQDAASGSYRHSITATIALKTGGVFIREAPIVRVSSLLHWQVELQPMWTHPELGEIFLSSAGELIGGTGIAHRMNSWVVDESIKILKDATGRYYIRLGIWQVTVALPSMIKSCIEKYGIPDDRVGVMIDVATLKGKKSAILESVIEFKTCGIGVALAGIDFANISMVCDLIHSGMMPEILVAASHVCADVSSPEGMRYLKALRLMAQHFQIPLLVTDVTTVERHEILRRMGVEFGQGVSNNV